MSEGPAPPSLRASGATGPPIDHRGLQRTLVRMQHDPDFAARLRAGDAAASGSTGLGPRELGWLRAADAAGLEADRGGRRAGQLLRNVASEFRLCAALGPRGDGERGWLAGFPRTEHFHAAVATGGSLPLAFGRWLAELAAGPVDPGFRSLVALEVAMARARREATAAPPTPPGCVRLSGAARLVELPAGTHALASALAAHAGGDAVEPDRLAALPRPAPRSRELVLLVADLATDARFGRLRPLRVEPLAPLVAAFLVEAEAAPRDRAARAAFARAYDADPDDVEAVVAEFVREGVLAASR